MRWSFNKYKARAVVVDGMRFDSKKEAARWIELKHLESAGSIANLRRQVRIPLHVNGKKVATYVADFVYQCEDATTVEDSKGFQTSEFKLKWKMVQAQYPEWRFLIS